MSTTKATQYDAQATAFLSRFHLAIAIELRTPEGCPGWDGPDSKAGCPRCHHIHGREYLVTVSRDPDLAPYRKARLSFAFWGAHADRPGTATAKHYFGETDALGRFRNPGKHPSEYDVLACLSSDASLPETADEVHAEFGDMKPSRAEEIAAAGRRVRAFFNADELSALGEIQ